MSEKNLKTVLIVGLDEIALTLGVSRGTVKNILLKRKDFPARQLKARGQWVSTRVNLENWANAVICQDSPVCE